MSTNKSSSHGLARSAGIIGAATLCSRILGFIRDAVIARLFGIYVYSQAFVIAFKIPNLFRDLLGEGAANAAFVPIFSEYALKPSKKEFWELSNVVLNLLLVLLMTTVLAGVACAPWIVRLIAPGFSVSLDKLETTVRLTRMLFPYVLLVSLAAYATALLNTLRHFSTPAFAPCLLNIAIIVCALVWGEGIKGLASGVLAGGVLQLGIQVPVLYAKGFRWRWSGNFRHPALKSIGRLMAPRLLSSCIYQLNNFVDTIFGSLARIVGEGGVSVLYFSYRLIQFPLGIFSNALSQALLPTFSTQVLENDLQRLKQTLFWGLRATFFVMVPASMAFMVLGKDIVLAIFGGGKFDAHSALLTAHALFFYSIGLSAYGATKIVQSCFFALKDTRTPAKVSALALLINIILNAVLMYPLKIGGIALATSVSGINSFVILFIILKHRIGDFQIKELLISFVRILASSAGMGLCCYLAAVNSGRYCPSLAFRLVRLGFLVALGGASYVFFCILCRVSEMKELWNWLVKRRKS